MRSDTSGPTAPVRPECVRPAVGRRLAAVLVLLVAGIPIGVARSDPALADSVGCTSAGGDIWFDQVCLEMKGEGLKVDRFKVGMSDHDLKGPFYVPAQICNYHATLTIDPPGRNTVDVRTSSRHEGCSTGYAWFDFDGGTYPHDTKVCGRFFTDGEQRGGAACNRILR